MKKVLWISFLFILFPLIQTEAKRIKHSLRVEKETKGSGKQISVNVKGINMTDSLSLEKDQRENLLKIKFAGYDKEANSSYESFLIINSSEKDLTGFEVKIDYLDMQDRMLHSRTIKEDIKVPSGETRRTDVKSWDIQHTYYYYLGNEPKKVATPYKVTFTPTFFWIEDQ